MSRMPEKQLDALPSSLGEAPFVNVDRIIHISIKEKLVRFWEVFKKINRDTILPAADRLSPNEQAASLNLQFRAGRVKYRRL